MSRRFRNLLCALAVSISMWGIIIQASLALYHAVSPSADSLTTASVR